MGDEEMAAVPAVMAVFRRRGPCRRGCATVSGFIHHRIDPFTLAFLSPRFFQSLSLKSLPTCGTALSAECFRGSRDTFLQGAADIWSLKHAGDENKDVTGANSPIRPLSTL